MLEELYVTGFVRDPTADAVVDQDGRWWIRLSPEDFEPVLPDGAQPDPGLGTGDTEVASSAAPLGLTLHTVVRNLMDVVLENDPDEAAMARALATHCRRFSVPSLCAHGRTPWGPHHDEEERPTKHSWAPPAACGLGLIPGSERYGLAVAHAVNLVSTMLALLDASDHLHKHASGLGPGIVDTILRSDILAAHLRDRVEAERGQDGGLDNGAARRLVATVLAHLIAGSAVQLTPRWPVGGRLRFAFAARTTTGAYALDLARHLDPLDESDRTYICSHCGTAFTPGRALRVGEGRYCGEPACRAARKAHNNRAARRRRKERDGQHPEAT